MIKIGKTFGLLALALCLGSALAGSASGQAEPAPAQKPIVIKPRSVPRAPAPGRSMAGRPDDVTTERSISIDPNAAIKLCVLEGRVRINGWNRSEMRVFVRNGGKFGIKVLEKDAETAKPNWLLVLNANNGRGPGSDCLSGESIEIDVPMQASLTVSGRSTNTTIDSVKKAVVKNIEGSIALRNITGGISAVALQGDLLVENSAGSISLETTTGNIAAYEVNPGQIGDLLRAKTNSGAISLQRLEHRQIEASSITGSVLFDGKFLSGGIYNFKTSNGTIRLLIPSDSSMMVRAAYGFGTFNSDLPLTYLTEDISETTKTIVARCGDGSASVNLTTTSGSIGIRKQ